MVPIPLMVLKRLKTEMNCLQSSPISKILVIMLVVVVSTSTIMSSNGCSDLMRPLMLMLRMSLKMQVVKAVEVGVEVKWIHLQLQGTN